MNATSGHLPECDLAKQCRFNPEHDVAGICLHCGAWCECARLRACEQRVTERHNAEHEDDRLTAFQNGYDAALVKERKRSALLIADAYGKGLDAARDAVANLPVAITVVYDTPFLNKQGMSVCEDPDKYPHGIVQVAALAAIDALRVEA